MSFHPYVWVGGSPFCLHTPEMQKLGQVLCAGAFEEGRLREALRDARTGLLHAVDSVTDGSMRVAAIMHPVDEAYMRAGAALRAPTLEEGER